ncbi:MAG: hypothetical protein ACK4GJ_00815 [bacterium]
MQTIILYDISEIIYKKMQGKRIELNGGEGNFCLSDKQNLEFVANAKSLPRIIEKMQRKGKNTLSEVGDVVRGRINCKDVHQAKQILEILQRELPKKNKEIIEIDDMISNPRAEYKGRIHLAIKDNETGVIFELQMGSKNITNFIERPVTINYGKRIDFINNGANIIETEDILNSTYHDLIYKALKKLKNTPKYKYLDQNFELINQKYIQIMDEIYTSEINNAYEKNKVDIARSIDEFDKIIISAFSKVNKEDMIKILGN